MNPTPSPSPILVELINSEPTTFWFTPILPGIFVLLGAVVAAILAFIFNRLNEARKAKRERDIRWDDEIRKQCAESVVVVHSIYKLATIAHDIEGERLPRNHARRKDYAAKKLSLLDELDLLNASLRLIAPVRIILASGELIDMSYFTLSRARMARERAEELIMQADRFVDVVRFYLK